MLRALLTCICLCAMQITGAAAFAEISDPYFDEDLRNANLDSRYSHLTTASEKVRIYRLHNCAPTNWDALDPNFNGTIADTTIAKLRLSCAALLHRSHIKDPRARHSLKTASLPGAGLLEQRDPPSPQTAHTGSVSHENGSGSGLVAYARKNLTDINSLIFPNPDPTAVGASVSYSNNQVAKNITWAGQAAVFAGYRYMAPNYAPAGEPFLLGFAIGPYYTINANYNPYVSPPTKNTDTQTYGGAAELGLGNLFGIDRLDEYTRVSLGGVQNYVAATSGFSGGIDFIPVYDPLLIHYPHSIQLAGGSYLGFRFDPEFRIQYDSANNGLLLFSNRKDALRIGPQFGLWVSPFQAVKYLENINFNLVYHVADEIYSGQAFQWFEGDLTYKLARNVGITASYQSGENEATGAQTRLYMVSITSALDYCDPGCPELDSDIR